MASEARHHRPVKFPTEKFDHYPGGVSPEDSARAAHISARIILERGRASTDPSVTKRLVHFTDEFGIEAVAQLWARATPVSIPGAMWRIYALRGVIRKNPQLISHYYQRGMHSNYAARVLAGVASPPTAEEICTTVDAILAGAFTGDFDIALERFAAFCRVLALGQDDVALGLRNGHLDVREGYPEQSAPALPFSPSAEVRGEAAVRAKRLRLGAQRLVCTAGELEAAAAAWRVGTLD